MMKCSDISFDELLQAYLKSHVLRESSIRNYRQIIRTIQKDLKVSFLNEVTEEAVLDWRNAILSRTSAITWNNYHTHMRALFNFALKKNWITTNIFLEVKKVRAPKLRKKTIELASLDSMLMTIQQYPDKFDPPWFWTTIIKVLFFTGMRQQQLLSLKWRDINFENREIFLTLEGSKTHREWAIPLPHGCQDVLLYLKEQTQRLQGPVAMRDHPVFYLHLFNPKFSGFGLSKHQIEGFFKKLSRLSGERISAHRLRHTMATLMAQSGENPDLKSLQYILGHTNIRTTMEYVEPKKEHLENFLNQLSLTIS
jgi:integrase